MTDELARKSANTSFIGPEPYRGLNWSSVRYTQLENGKKTQPG